MNYVILFVCVEATFCIVTGVKVNMQGSLVLGKEVLDSLSYYLGKNVLNGRRSLIPAPIEDPTTLNVRVAVLCKDLEFCQEELLHFVDEYVIILAKAVESILHSSLPYFSNETYSEQLKYSLEYIRKILEDANAKVNDNNEYYWIQTIKKINAKFQEMVDVFVTEGEYSNGKRESKVKKDTRRKTIIANTFIERKYQIKLCSDHNICSKSHECTIALDKILTQLKTVPEHKIRMFVKHVYGSLHDSSFYNHLSESNAHEFQIILNDMAYANDTPAKDLLLSVQKTVAARMEVLKTNKPIQVAHDILIAHVILSDLDHMFSKRINPFIMFLNRFYDWLASDTQIAKEMHAVVTDITKEIWLQDEYLVKKLINEVKVFLEMTVGTDK